MKLKIKRLPFERLRLLDAPFVYEHEVQDRWVWDTARRDYYNLWICLEGDASMRCDGVAYAVRPWSVFLLPPEVRVYGDRESPEGMLQNFGAHWVPNSVGEVDLPKQLQVLGHVIHEVDTAQALIQAMIRVSSFQDALSKQQGEWLLLELIALIWRESQTPHETPADFTIYQQIERIRAGLRMFATVDELAAEANLSRVHYGRCFQRITGEPPNRFLIRQRIERACVLLRGTNGTIESISEKIGYSDVYFFSRQFRQQMNQTPRRYRLAL